MILTDGIHLVATESLDELHSFAKKIGLKREWFQGPPDHKHPHYDLTTNRMRQKAIQNGAIYTSSKVLIKYMVRK